ncbi:hypothetical protein CS374_02845 [Porphyromonas gingivalis]|nr:hypothetical protein CS374_02845 [Porphyromonas gingivalis]
MAHKFFAFGSGNEKFSHHNETILAPFFQKTRAAIGAFLVRVSMTAGYRHWRDRIDVGALWLHVLFLYFCGERRQTLFARHLHSSNTFICFQQNESSTNHRSRHRSGRSTGYYSCSAIGYRPVRRSRRL